MVAKISNETLLWTKIQEIKDLDSKNQTDSCFALVSDDVITENFQNLSKILGLNVKEHKLKNLAKKIIQNGVEMFLYLNSCENKEEKLFWKDFYKNIMSVPLYIFGYEYRSMKEILLQISKSLHSCTSKDEQKIANKIVKRLSSDVKFQYLQPNNDESNIIWTRNVQNMIGKLCRIYTQTLYF